MNVKEIRAITGLSQRQFAEKYGLNKRTLQNWEGGANRPPQGFEKLLLRAVMDDEEKEETKSTESSTGYTEEQEILSTALAYLDDAELECSDCKYNNLDDCRHYECCIKNWKDYDKLIEIFKKLGVEHK